MEDQYGGMPDLHHYIDGRPLFPAISHPPELMPSQYPYDMLVFRSDTGVAVPSDGGGAGRWPRQETLTLLEIRSKLDPKFKEANQKGPLWDEVSRILWQEHGYQRSGKKCREKFENLYKYYKKTKEGKAGRQDGKHYRFFRQLEALYGAADDHQTKVSDASFPDSCDAASSYCSESNAFAADDEDYSRMMRKKGKRSMKAEIEASVEAQMKEMMEKQEAWMERMTTVIEGKEAERLRREEQWRRQDAARIAGEQKMWASERAWVESRDAALMEAFHRLAGKQLQQPLPPPPPPQQQQAPVWPELMQLRSGMELRFGENGMMQSEESAWDEISAKMAAASTAGGGGSGGREKLDQAISDYLIKCSKKRRENAKASTYGYHQNRVSIPDHGVAGGEGVTRMHGGETNRSSGDDGLFRYLIGDSCQRYYDLK